MSADADGCGPHCPDNFPHNHYYGGARNPTRLPVGLEAAMQERAAQPVQRYTAAVAWGNADGLLVDTWTHAEPDTMANVLRMLTAVAERPPLTAHVRIEPEPLHETDAAGRCIVGGATASYESKTVVPSEFFDELAASLDEPAVPNEATRDAFRRLGETVERRD